ncbi:hypothetical protein [Methanoregula sp.]|jgi:hypothetical protein|uniref:hypothetical protein n=1 Tax=Methanoregula sp. TaxID=2052170 RepID=UPI003C7136FA
MEQWQIALILGITGGIGLLIAAFLPIISFIGQGLFALVIIIGVFYEIYLAFIHS